jgi:hypothetical protein
MRPTRARYVTACQQLLALGVVLVALAPAAGVVSLDVVGVEPEGQPAPPVVELRPHARATTGPTSGGVVVEGWKGRSYDGPG